MNTWTITEADMRGLSLRLALLSAHYRKPVDVGTKELNRCAKTLRRWLLKAVPCQDGPPLPVLEALTDDLNTPQAIAELHQLAKTDGRSLFAGMRFLGLIPNEGAAIDYGSALEIKTLPHDAIPSVEWEGFGTVGST